MVSSTEKKDRAFSKFIIRRDGICFTCGSVVGLTCGHLFPRANMSVRYDPRAAFAQCGKCNLYHEENPKRFINLFIARFGKEVYDELYSLAHSNTKERDAGGDFG